MQRSLNGLDVPALLPPFTECSEAGCALPEHRQGLCQTHWLDRFFVCDSCGEDTEEGFGPDIGLCESCYDDRYVVCERCNAEVIRDEAEFPDCGPYAGDSLCQSCFERCYTICDGCSETVATEDTSHGYCDDCYSDRYTSCDDCGCSIGRDEANTNDNGETYCNDCHKSGEWNTGRFYADEGSSEVGSSRKYGIELETSECPSHYELEGQTIFGCKEDGSISGMEFISPPLSGDKGLAVIRNFCGIAGRYGFRVDSHCGYHLHLDMRGVADEGLRRVAAAYAITQRVWQSFVSSARARNNYCTSLGWGPHDAFSREFTSFAGGTNRYGFLNLNSYYKHSTFEIRLHSATLQPAKIINWIKAHTRFIDGVLAMSDEDVKAWQGLSTRALFVKLAELWADDELTEFYTSRAAGFGKPVAGPVAEPADEPEDEPAYAAIGDINYEDDELDDDN